VKRILKTLTAAATLTLLAVAGCSREHQETSPPTNAPGPATPTSEQPKIIEKPAPPTATPEQKPKQEEAPKGA
jgi:hypothetical protein